MTVTSKSVQHSVKKIPEWDWLYLQYHTYKDSRF